MIEVSSGFVCKQHHNCKSRSWYT